MVLDIASFRTEEGGDPGKMLKLQNDRFKVCYDVLRLIYDD